VFLVAIIGLSLAATRGSAAAAIDLSGDYVVSDPIPCRLTDVQTGTALQVSGSCSVDSTTYAVSLAGTVDPATGAFSVTGKIPGLCADLACSGTGDGEETQITCTSSTSVCNGPLLATKCGNGAIDPLENCEDGNHADGDCCSARCRLDAAGTACTSDGNACTDDGCNATGACTHVLNTGLCDDGNACTIGDGCAGGACVPGAPAPAGQACSADIDPCTADVCDGAATCTHVPVSPVECRRAVACHSTCTEELRACKRACAKDGRARRDCRAACAERSNCTAPGARIRTLAYVVSECTTDAQGRSSLKQTLLIRRGNCDPVRVMEAGPSTPVPDSSGLCRSLGLRRNGAEFVALKASAFQAIAVVPDGSGVVFDVTKQFSETALEPPEEGIFFVRSDGTGLRGLGPPSRVPSVNGEFRWPASPDGRSIAFIDLGPSTAGYDAPQVFLLDIRSGQRRQLTRQSRVAMMQNGDPGIWLPSFLDSRTVGFYAGSTGTGTFTAFQVKTDGKSEPTGILPITPASGARIVSAFGVTGGRPHAVLGLYPDRPAENHQSPGPPFVREVFLLDRHEIVQLTAFNRNDTAPGGEGARGVIIGDRVLFEASANPLRENPGQVCQLFSISTRGDELRQVTHLPWDGEPYGLGCISRAPSCGIWPLSTASDRVSGAVLFSASCDPVGANPFGEQIFAMRPDGSGLRQLTNARGMTTDPDGTVHVEIAGPFAYPTSRP
jgi:cysteine-rich repeat protein